MSISVRKGEPQLDAVALDQGANPTAHVENVVKMRWKVIDDYSAISECKRYCVCRVMLNTERTYEAWLLSSGQGQPSKQLACGMHSAREAQDTCIAHSISNQPPTKSAA